MDWLKEFDLNAFRAVHVGLRNPVLDVLALLITSTGLGWVQLAVISPFVARPKTRSGALQVLLVAALAGLSNLLLKDIVPRERPSNLVWADPRETAFYDSFPSGHSVTSFGIAFTLFFLTRDGEKRWIGWAALVWASLVGLSRMYQGVHWLTDVVGGIAIGLFWACAVVLVKQRRSGSSPVE